MSSAPVGIPGGFSRRGTASGVAAKATLTSPDEGRLDPRLSHRWAIKFKGRLFR